MNLSTQLRIILLVAGAAIWLTIYLLGKRKSATQQPAALQEQPGRELESTFEPITELDEEELDTPAYMRRQGQREARQDYEPRIADVEDYADLDDVPQYEQRFMDADTPEVRRETRHDVAYEVEREVSEHTAAFDEPIYAEQANAAPPYAAHAAVYDELAPNSSNSFSAGKESVDESINEVSIATTQEPVIDFDQPTFEPRVFEHRREPSVSLDTAQDADEWEHPSHSNSQSRAVSSEPLIEPRIADSIINPSSPSPVPVMAESVASPLPVYVRAERGAEAKSAPMPTPTLSDVVRKPQSSSVSATSLNIEPSVGATAAPRVAVSESPAVTKPAATNTAATARRKIIALRLPMPTRVAGASLLSLLQGERLQYGKFNIFHRMQGTGTVFSVASMVEPGTFDPNHMAEQDFPGVTLFMMLPGPLDGLVAYDQMLSCAQRLAHATGGTLQDERGSKLTPHSMERLREEVLDFQHLIGGMSSH